MSHEALGRQFPEPYDPQRTPRLFHGTEADLQPGDIVGPKTKKVAHATPALYTARVFGSKVYEVEPVNPEETFTSRMKHTGNEVHYETLSEHGFRVLRAVPKSRRESYYNKPR